MFANQKGTVKYGKVIARNSRLIEDEYEDVIIIETEEGKVYHANESHIIQLFHEA